MDYEKKFKEVRDAFLNMLADGKWDIDYDADTNDAGRQIDCSTYTIHGPISSLEQLCDALAIKRNRVDESLDDAMLRAIEEDPPTS